VKFGQNIAEMKLNGFDRDVQVCCNLMIARPGRDTEQDFGLPASKRGEHKILAGST
jgi:hypothetical protein